MSLVERYGTSVIQTTRLLDFSPFKTARLKGELRMYMQRAIGGCGAEVEVDLCGVEPVSEQLCGTAGEVLVTKMIDVNVSDVLDCVRATLKLTVSVGGWYGPGTLSDNEVYVEVRNLRIVVMR
jgi:hypothetical protein